MKNKTSLVIAHRLSTILDADRIVLLHNGKIEAIGKHNHLLKILKFIKIYINYSSKTRKKIMIKKLLQNEFTQNILGFLISIYIKFCFQTSLWYSKNDENIEKLIKNKRKILVLFWHNRLLMAAFLLEI